MHHIFFIYSSTDEYLDWFHGLAKVNSVTINKGMQVSLLYSAFDSFG
jgi:hypothetical protein